jgi:hypothetical protein
VPAGTCLLEPSGSVICSISAMATPSKSEGPAVRPGLESVGASCWNRTSDPHRVKVVFYR